MKCFIHLFLSISLYYYYFSSFPFSPDYPIALAWLAWCEEKNPENSPRAFSAPVSQSVTTSALSLSLCIMERGEIVDLIREKAAQLFWGRSPSLPVK